ncbi:aminotransferase class I/II-fold pyridoxal phosphate-dependent enzyme [Streptosporangium sp. NBC_01755]|uniref:trans-sulfuration enzyme family protein n=1 Tax=unclassified Streptosporangium TaxID=2632669 RepID=UPI002DDA4794|nr:MULTISPECIES: aminotransferase class I/II-fold pyridoxal phosphate-dependent enzyme [unclassified Streptosporangium]WSA23048.1 aminotransferase class I/II-fold pyridoxal phosphate-dependent enzyme [Streptosporangium sp. NBC_01810]WSC98808.1 aminotransferase class I/II-fold pyridoxal phosphate-dependent enzyme [Streptosporangium sp. NBC_01755]
MADFHPETRTVHLPQPPLNGSRPIAVPLYQTSGFVFDDPAVFADGMGRPDGAFVYGRLSNPTVRSLEEAVAGLEGGVGAVATGSGMGAINSVLFALLEPGDHLIAQQALYGGTASMINDLERRFRISVSYVPEDDPAALRAAVRPETKLVYLETIANPVTQVADLPGMCAAAREAGLVSVVDNTFASPILCRPLEHGADIVVHSTTKYLSGHTDVLGGIAVFASDELYREVWAFNVKLGATADPFAAWLTLRGIQTLPLRMERHCFNTRELATRLNDHPAVSVVHWPGLPSHPSYALAAKLLPDFGGVFSFDLTGGRAAGERFMSSVRLALLAPSLGGVETLVLHPATTSHRSLTAEELARHGVGEGTVRVAVGIEHIEDLWADFEQALF